MFWSFSPRPLATILNLKEQRKCGREIARIFGDLKFCEIRADLCIEGYPEKNCPTILVYHDGNIIQQTVTLKDLGGQRTARAGKLGPLVD